MALTRGPKSEPIIRCCATDCDDDSGTRGHGWLLGRQHQASPARASTATDAAPTTTAATAGLGSTANAEATTLRELSALRRADDYGGDGGAQEHGERRGRQHRERAWRPTPRNDASGDCSMQVHGER